MDSREQEIWMARKKLSDAQSDKADAGLEREAVRNEVLKFMPKGFVELYELLVWSALGPGLGVKLESGGDGDKGALTRIKVEGAKVDAINHLTQWLCSCGVWNSSSESFCHDCDRMWEAGLSQRMNPESNVTITEGGVVDVGKPQRARLSTSEDSVEGRVTRGPAKGSAHGKREGARRRPVVGEEYAIALRSRLDRSLVRIVRDLLRDVQRSSRGSETLRSAASDLGESSELSNWRKCSRVRMCGRVLEAHWLFCPYCGAPAIDCED